MQTSIGLLYIFKQIFMHYVSLTGPLALIVLFVGLFATIAGLIMLFIRPSRKHIAVLSAISILPLCIGIGGTVLWAHQTQGVAVSEKHAGIKPSAQKYYDLEYGYSRALIHWFPAIVGAVSTLPPILLVIILRLKSKAQDVKRATK